MLVLTRKVGEALIVGSEINLTVLEVKRNSVKIGIEAPDEVPIYRHEVYFKIREENRNASAAVANEITAMAGLFKTGRPPRT